MTIQLKKEATNGSLSALAALCGDATKDANTFPFIINAIRQHLLTTPVPRLILNPSLTRCDDSNLQTVHSCFLCLQTALSDDTLNNACNVALVSRLWPHMCRWITSFLDSHVVNVSIPSLETLLQNQTFFDMTDAILSLLLTLSSVSPILTCILETEDFLRSFTHSTVCLMAVTQNSSLQPVTTTLLVRFWKPTGDSIHPAMADILHEMPSQRIIASLQGVVHKIQELAFTPSSLRSFAHTIHFLWFVTAKSENICQRYLAQRSIQWICHLLSRIMAKLRVLPSPEIYRDLETIFYISMVYLVQLCFTRGTKWLLQGLQHHILELALKSIPFASESGPLANPSRAPSLLALLSQLCDTTYTFLVQRCVISEAGRALGRITRAGLEANVSLADDSFRKSWTLLTDQIARRSQYRSDFIAAGCDNDSCSNPMCPQRLTIANRKKPLQMCSGCKNYFYCTRDCQKVMWPSHKPVCKIIQERTKEGFFLHFTERDMHFIGEMSSHDIHNETTQLREDKKRFLRTHPEAAAYPLVLAVDYSSAPMTITIRSSLDFKGHPEHGKSWSSLVRKVKEDPRNEMVYIETPFNADPRNWLYTTTFQLPILGV
ncbi:uncharacterized protein ARMOST_11220 [Armillaria ostoyae]|uniref:MYND-type domain-containing protein n=1 Tax=Armillaria ostoyae TaxID=47428 RepID=A0A284RGI5_ARMOS|nr:uncharacterized protein ARMOST_11220 [Armillaria ostoyae]